jgi:glycosyltransferase involved in cell wall biosynthesis
MNPLISVITPSLNSGRYLEEAIQSVVNQRYQSFEHIIVDGGSTDGSLEVLRRYPHLDWISEADHGQSDAMNKGFAKARGDVIVYLNADDYFEPGAFAAASTTLAAGATFVVGRVRIQREDGSATINDPKVSLSEMLRWWQPDAYCYNSAGYFYRREVQQSVGPFNLSDHLTMDYEFLIEAARRYGFTRIPDVLASFRYVAGTKSFENARSERETFNRFQSYISLLDDDDRSSYRRELEAMLAEPPPLP